MDVAFRLCQLLLHVALLFVVAGGAGMQRDLVPVPNRVHVAATGDAIDYITFFLRFKKRAKTHFRQSLKSIALLSED
jgi:hypothetical protein